MLLRHARWGQQSAPDPSISSMSSVPPQNIKEGGSLTDDLLRLEPNPPSLIFKGATFFVLGFFISGIRGLALGFRRALGPGNRGACESKGILT